MPQLNGPEQAEIAALLFEHIADPTQLDQILLHSNLGRLANHEGKTLPQQVNSLVRDFSGRFQIVELVTAILNYRQGLNGSCPPISQWLERMETVMRERGADSTGRSARIIPKTNKTTETITSNTPGFQYWNKWIQAFEKAGKNFPGLSNQVQADEHLSRFVVRLLNHRLDKYIWPAVQYRRGTPTMASRSDYLDDDDWTTIDSENEVRNELTSTLVNNPLVLMHDDAGMGKTAFSWMLFEHLLKKNESHPYVIRLEGKWPRSIDNQNPLPLMEVLLAELLGKRVVGLPVHKNNTGGDSEEALKESLKTKCVFIVLDGLDQMTEGDRAVALTEIQGTIEGNSDISNCHWLVSGRTFAFRDVKLTTIVRDHNVLRFRLKRFDKERQDKYFEDLERNPFFSQQQDKTKRKPLDYMCSTWRAGDDTNDLGIPLHLAEIRRVIEAVLPLNTAGRTGKTLGEIYSSSDLHARVSNVYLERVVKQTLGLPPPQNKCVPPDTSMKIKVLRQVCSCLAIQMMFDCNYNASIDNGGTDLIAYDGIAEHKLVEAFLARSRKRYEQLVAAPESYWDWAIDLLEKIEVTHRGDVDTFKPECRAFRDLKAMEWYASFYLINYSTEADWNERISDSENPNAKSWQGDERWTRCWQLAMEMPAGYYSEKKLKIAIENVFASPLPSQRRPCEWMWIAWVNRLKQNEMAIKKNLLPLNCREKVIAEFRRPFKELIKAKDLTALTLQYIEDRDSPDFKIKHPNQTENGWYRRIPDKGDCTKFRLDGSYLVTVSQFWIRKFVVTVKEYLLFDPSHPNSVKLEEAKRPVTIVNWFHASMFCYWLGPGYRLPTAAEWETACRANELKNGVPENQTSFWFGNNVEEAPFHAWVSDNSQNRPHSLADSIAEERHQNRFGLFDMSGNVDEWCSDWGDDDFNDGEHVNGDMDDPKGPIKGVERVNRGGSFSSQAKKSAQLSADDPSYCFASVGFRVALSLKSPELDK